MKQFQYFYVLRYCKSVKNVKINKNFDRKFFIVGKSRPNIGVMMKGKQIVQSCYDYIFNF